MFPLSFDNDRFLVFWRFDDQNDNIFIHLRVKTTGWIGFGFAETAPSNMMNYDVIVGGYSNGQGYLNVSFTHTSSHIDKYLNLLHLHFTRSLWEKILWRLRFLFKNLSQHSSLAVECKSEENCAFLILSHLRACAKVAQKKDAIKRPKNKEIQGDKECFSVSDTGGSEVKNSSTPDRSRSYDLLVTSLDTLPLISYRRFEGAKTTVNQESNLRPSGY